MIKDFTEKDIRKAILNKVNPTITHKSKHWKGSIYIDDILISKVKIPNEHTRIMKEKKSKFIAKALRLKEEQFNGLIDCSIKGTEYYQLQRKIGE